MDHDKMSRLKDEFYLAARARPATAEHYVAWLEGYLDAGGKVDTLSFNDFSRGEFVTASQDCKLPPLENYYAIKVIALPGVDIDTSDAGDCVAYLVDGATRKPAGKVPVWVDMLEPLLADGYTLSQLVPAEQLKGKLRDIIVTAVLGSDRLADYYEAFSRVRDFERVREMQDSLRKADITGQLLEALSLPPKTPLDAFTRNIVDEQLREATRALDVLHYKHDPKNDEPVAVFKRRSAKPAVNAVAPVADPVALNAQMEVGPPLRLKKRRTKPKANTALPK